MEARVNSEMLICCSKTSDWAFYEAWAEEYKPWMIGTVGLTIQTILPDFPITQGAAQNSREKLSLLSKKSSAAADIWWCKDQVFWGSSSCMCPNWTKVFWWVCPLHGPGPSLQLQGAEWAKCRSTQPKEMEANVKLVKGNIKGHFFQKVGWWVTQTFRRKYLITDCGRKKIPCSLKSSWILPTQ